MSLVGMNRITKSFSGFRALDNVDFEVDEGEIHALVGENGAGKTSLMNILYGIYHADAGDLRWKGSKLQAHSPTNSIRAGIGMVHQHFMLVPTLTVSENITLGTNPVRALFRNRNAANARIRELSKRYGIDLDPNALVRSLSVGVQQRVEIMKVLYRQAELLILDEPTAMLTPQETERLFFVLQRLREDGRSIVLITHRLSEVMKLSDRVTVLRKGCSEGIRRTNETNESELSRLMIGRTVIPVARATQSSSAQDKKLGLEARLLRTRGDELELGKRSEGAGISLEIRSGEILGLAGVEGNGQRELFETIVGLRQPYGGALLLSGEDITRFSVKERRSRGLAWISDDRHRDGLVLQMSPAQNLLLSPLVRARVSRNGLLDAARATALLDELVQEYGIALAAKSAPVSWMSGGNQQKLILARELLGKPLCIVAFQPTRGLDIAAGSFVESRLLQQAATGCAVVLISGDLEQLLRLSSRLAVIQKHRITGLFHDPRAVDLDRLGLLMGGYHEVAS